MAIKIVLLSSLAAHAFSDAKKKEITTLYNNKYWDATFSYACELLEQHDGISISLSALTNILYKEYIPSPRSSRKTKKRMAKELRHMQKTLRAKKRLLEFRAALFLWKIPIPDVHVALIFGK